MKKDNFNKKARNKIKTKNNNSKNKIKKRKIKIDKKINIKKIEKSGNLTRKKRMKVSLIIAFVLLVCFSLRIGYIQFIMGSNLKSMAYIQQTLDRKINPKRGTIYDATR